MAKVQGNKVAEAAMAVTRQRMAAQAQGVAGTPAADPEKAAE
jgi:hypothetical protein